MRVRFILVLALCVGCAQTRAQSADPKAGESETAASYPRDSPTGFRATRTGHGPLLLVGTRTDDRTSEIYVVDPNHGELQRVWRGSGRSPSLWIRLDRDRVLLSHGSQLLVLSMAKGVARPLPAFGAHTQFLAADSQRVFFVRYLAEGEPGGVELKQAPDGRTALGRDPLQRPMALHAVGIGPFARTRPHGLVPLELILEVHEGVVWAVSAENERHLLRIDPDGTATRIVAFDSDWVAPLHYAFSPGGNYLALELKDRRYDTPEEWTLVVVDLVKKRIVSREDRLVAVVHTWGIQPPLLVGWIGDRYVSHFTSRTVVDAQTGRRIPRAEAKRRSLGAPKPRRSARWVQFPLSGGYPIFSQRKHHQENPNVLSGHVPKEIWSETTWAMDAEETWLAYELEDTVTLLNRRTGTKSVLMRGGCESLRWLPSAD